jgi:hypothetical protein
MKAVTDVFKTQFKNEREFFKSIFLAKTKYLKKKLLKNASNEQLNLLGHILHFISTKRIHLAKEKLPDIRKGKKWPFLINNFQDEANFDNFLKLNRAEQEKILHTIGFYDVLLHRLFHLK